MAQVMKNAGKFLNVQGHPSAHQMKTQTAVPGNTAHELNARPTLRAGLSKIVKPFVEDSFGDTPIEIEKEPSEDEIRRSLLEKERKRLLAEYEEEARRIRADAVDEANAILNDAEEKANQLIADTEVECEQIKVETAGAAYKEGYDSGFADGESKGYDEGYNKGLRKCKDTLKELMSLLEETTRVKEEVFNKHEHDLFDAIFTIANKITIDSLKQKDKAVLQKMLKEAARSFRNSEYIKVSLSKLDVTELGNAELDVMREIFRENQHIEFEILKDAPAGTLTLDNGSEIIDAGVATQLKMIENLGKGKFRDRLDDDE